MTQDEINELLIGNARAGRIVVRLKGGDPLVFGRGGEEAASLQEAGIPFEIVPGVTAGLGVTAYAGIPVTHRDASSAVAFVTGHDDPESDRQPARLDWSALARFPGTLVVYMGVTHLAAICRTLIKHGKAVDTPAAVIESGTSRSPAYLGRQRSRPSRRSVFARACAPLLSWSSARWSSFGTKLEWFEHLPLFGQRVAITRPRQDALRAASVLERLGAEVLLAPTVEVKATG